LACCIWWNTSALRSGLGRDAAPVEADAAQILALDNRGLQTQLGRADRRDIATGARTQNDHIILFSHCLLLNHRAGPPGVIDGDKGEDRFGHLFASS
jgi:hypothetical protein